MMMRKLNRRSCNGLRETDTESLMHLLYIRLTVLYLREYHVMMQSQWDEHSLNLI